MERAIALISQALVILLPIKYFSDPLISARAAYTRKERMRRTVLLVMWMSCIIAYGLASLEWGRNGG